MYIQLIFVHGYIDHPSKIYSLCKIHYNQTEIYYENTHSIVKWLKFVIMYTVFDFCGFKDKIITKGDEKLAGYMIQLLKSKIMHLILSFYTFTLYNIKSAIYLLMHHHIHRYSNCNYVNLNCCTYLNTNFNLRKLN